MKNQLREDAADVTVIKGEWFQTLHSVHNLIVEMHASKVNKLDLCLFFGTDRISF